MMRHSIWIVRGLRPVRVAALAVLSAAITVALIVSLAPPTSADTAPLRLRLVAWQSEGDPDLRECYKLVDEYSAKHPGIKIDMTHDRWDTAYDQLSRWSGSWAQYAPDMTIIPDEWLGDFAPMLMTFGSALDRLLGRFIPAALAPRVIDGRIHGVPWQMDAWCLYYRPDLLPEGREAPATWDELLACARDIATDTAGVHGLGLPGAECGGGAHRLLMLLWGAGGNIKDGEGNIHFISKELVEALDFYVRLSREGALQPEVLSWDSVQLQDEFSSGRVAMIIAGSSVAHTLRSSHPAVEFAIAPLPTRERPFAAIASTSLVILRTTQHRDECMDFLRHVVSEQGQYRLFQSGAVPCHETLVAAAGIDPLRAPFTANLDNAFGRPGRHWRDIEAMLDDAIFLALSGRYSAAEALQRVQTHYLSSGTDAAPTTP